MADLYFESEKYGKFSVTLQTNTRFTANDFLYHDKAATVEEDLKWIKSAEHFSFYSEYDRLITINRKTYKGIIASGRLMEGHEPTIWFQAREYGVILTDAARKVLEDELSGDLKAWILQNKDRLIQEAVKRYKAHARESLRNVIQNAKQTLKAL
jgi:hypothetical protein